MIIRRRVLITGRVQGVFFRDSCRSRARERGVAGWVTNCDDGRVEAVFEGEPSAVAAMITWCHRGPSQARVSDVTVSDEDPEGESSFTVR